MKQLWVQGKTSTRVLVVGTGIGLQIRNLENHLAFPTPLSRNISFVFQYMEEVQMSTHHSEKTQAFLHSVDLTEKEPIRSDAEQQALG